MNDTTEFDEYDGTCTGADGAELVARYYVPRSAGAEHGRPLVLDVHGGAWGSTNRLRGVRYCRPLAADGWVVMAPDFRDGRQGRHPLGSRDISAALASAIASPELRIDPDRVALIGSSSGGHLAMYTALRMLDAPVRFVGAFWPPADPLARYRYAKSAIGAPVPEGQQFEPALLAKLSEAYFGDEVTMAEASIANVVRRGDARCLPRLWVVCAGEDLNVPRSIVEELEAAYRSAGGEVEVTLYEGEVHGFGAAETGRPATRKFIEDLRARIAKAFAG